jgi:hypothetical protein
MSIFLLLAILFNLKSMKALEEDDSEEKASRQEYFILPTEKE